jgi:hypothetical protein
MFKTLDSKNNSSNNEKTKQLNAEKKEMSDKVDKFAKEVE